MLKWSITYSKVTPESAERGDHSEHGWWMPGQLEYPLDDEDGYYCKVLEQAQAGDFDHTGTLSELISMAQELGICACEGADWFYTIDGSINYQTSETTQYCLHLDKGSARHFDRVARFLAR